MISLTAVIRVKKGSEEDMRDALSDIVEYTRTHEPGTIGYFLSQGIEDHCEFTTYERYADKNAMEQHNNSKKLAEFFEFAKPLFEGEVLIRICEEVAVK